MRLALYALVFAPFAGVVMCVARFPISQVKTEVYKNRIRIKDFFVDYDKLRSGSITRGQFQSGLSAARMALTPTDLEALTTEYETTKGDGEKRVCYVDFVHEIESVFTKPNLEKNPLEEVSNTPGDIMAFLSPKRFDSMPKVTLDASKEEKCQAVLDELIRIVKEKCVDVKPKFDDAAKNQNSAMSVNHVTKSQFKQALKAHIAPDLRPADVDILVEKFMDKPGMVNYVAFARVVDPPPKGFDPYTLAAKP